MHFTLKSQSQSFMFFTNAELKLKIYNLQCKSVHFEFQAKFWNRPFIKLRDRTIEG